MRTYLRLVPAVLVAFLGAASACGTSPACQPVGGPCGGAGQCCGTALCDVTKGLCAAPGCDGVACVDSSACCAGRLCSRFLRTCQAPSRLSIGDVCTDDSQCVSNQCSGSGYCTSGCAVQKDCSGGTFCLQTSSGFLCVPACQTSADCRVFGMGLTCQQATDPAGGTLSGCFSP